MVSHRLLSDPAEPAWAPTIASPDGSRDVRLPFRGSTLVELLDARADERPSGLAYVFLRDGEVEDARWTWGDVRRRSLAVAARLRASVADGERALLLYPAGLDFIAAFFGCLQAGVIAVPVPPPQGSGDTAAMARLRAVAADAAPAAVLTTGTMRARWTAEAGECCRPSAGSGRHAVMPGSLRCPWIATDDAVAAGDAAPWRPAASDLAFLQYTSGSTASPRGVMVSHANLLHNLASMFALAGDGSHGPSVSWLPATHDMGLIEGVLHPLYRGDAAYLMSPAAFLQRPLRWLKAISAYRAVRSGGPNFAYDLAARRVTAEARAELDLSGWQVAYSGAEPIRHETLALFTEAFAPCGFRTAAFRTAYGLAEATLVVSAGRWNRPGGGSVSCGRTAAGTSVVIVDPGTGHVCPEGRAGEVWIRGPGVAQGYWRRPDESARVFAAHTADGQGPFLRSGDLGSLIDGELHVTGRLKDLLIVRGVKHFPQDLEHTAEGAHAAVRRGCVAAVAVGTAVGGDVIGILAEIEPRRLDQELEIAGVIDLISATVCEAHGVRPGVVALLPAGVLPKTTSGKLQRFLCREGWLAGAFPVLARTAA
jgi:acyl-CoA synthetase (AMP-forming)/AMP-acid ligase II